MENFSEKNQRDLLVDTQEEERPLLSPWLLKLIIKDDAEQLESALEAMSPAARMAFLTGQGAGLKTGLYKHPTDSWACLEDHHKASPENKTEFSSGSKPKRDRVCELQIHKPWLLAGAYGSLKVIKCMLGRGADAQQMDNWGYTIIHALILVAHLEYKREPKCNDTLNYLKSLLDESIFKELLLTEDNHEGLRPLEMASHFGTLLLFRTIFETKGIYLAKETTTGIYKTQLFDITDYESPHAGNRRYKSPLLTITCIDRRKVSCPWVRKSLLTSPTGVVMKKWIQAKMLINTPMIIVWFVIRALYILIFFSSTNLGEDLVDMNTTSIISFSFKNSYISGNSSNYTNLMMSVPMARDPYKFSDNPNTDVPVPLIFAMFSYLLIHSICIIFADISEFYQFTRGSLAWLLRTPAGPKQMAVHFKTYRLAQFSMAISVTLIIILVLALQGKVIVIPRYVDHFFLIHAMCCIVISLKFFLQATSCLGPFIISFERMLKHLICFTAVFFFFAIPYTIVFRHVVCDNADDELCKRHFNTWSDSIYSVFTITLNMISFGDFQLKNRVELYLMHITYVFIIIMLLLNFLVAHFTRSVSQIMDNSHVIMPIQRLSLAWCIEFRAQRLIPGLYRKLRRRHFVAIGDRLFISRTLVALSDAEMEEEDLSTGTSASADNSESSEDQNMDLPRASRLQLRPIFPFPL